MFTILLIIVAAFSFITLIGILARHWKQLAAINVASIPEVRAEEIKKQVVARRFERKAAETRERMRMLGRSIHAAQGKFFNALIERIKAGQQRVTAKSGLRFEVHQIEDALSRMLNVRRTKRAQVPVQAPWHEQEAVWLERLKIDPHDLEAFIALGDLYTENAHKDEALATYEHVLKLIADREDAHDPTLRQQQISIYRALIELLMNIDQPERAIDYARDLLTLEPRNPKSLDLVLNLSIMLGRTAQAQEILDVLTEVNPDNQRLQEYAQLIRANVSGVGDGQ